MLTQDAGQDAARGRGEGGVIKVGTVCYLTGDHSRAGQCCTVVGPLTLNPLGCFTNNGRGEINHPIWLYPIDLASGDRGTRGNGWGAEPHNLIPIVPPGLTKRETTREPVAA